MATLNLPTDEQEATARPDALAPVSAPDAAPPGLPSDMAEAAPEAEPQPDTQPAPVDPATPTADPAPPRKPQGIEPPPTDIEGFSAIDDLPSFSERYAAAWMQRTVETDMWGYSNRVSGELTDEMFAALSNETQARLAPEFQRLEANESYYAPSIEAKRALIMAELSKMNPEAQKRSANNLPMTEAGFQAELLRRRRATYDDATAVLDVNGAGFAGFLGGMSRDIADPINLALAPIGISGSAARVIAAETVLGAVAGAASLPREFQVADELGLQRPNAAARIATEGLASGALAGIFTGVVRGAAAYKQRKDAKIYGKPEDVPDWLHDEALADGEAALRDDPPRRTQPDQRADPRAAPAGTPGATGPTVPDFDFSARGNASPNTNRVGYVVGKLIEGGMEPHIAIGFVGNFMVESTAALNPSIRGDGGAAYGIAQWNDRRPALFAFAARRGTDPSDLDTQIAFVQHELQTSEAGAWGRIRQARTAADAAALVSKYYERPGVPHLDRRIGYAQGLMNQFENGEVPKGAGHAPTSYVPQTTRAGYTSQGQVRTAGGTRIDAEYVVVDASVLVRATGDLQPRDRSQGNSDAWISDTAATLDPALLMPSPTVDRGAPIIGPDNVIESGNGRVAAIARAAELHPDRIDAYRQQIEAAGFDIPNDVRTPVLVGRRTSELTPDERRAFVVEGQDSGVARMTPVERSRAEAAGLSSDTLSRLVPGKALTDAENADFARAALARLPRSERNAFITPEGRLNADGRDALERALFARAFNDPELLRRFTERDAAELRSLMDALFEASPAWARLVADLADGTVKREFDITGHVLEAMRLIAASRKQAGTEGRKTAEVLTELLDDVDLMEGAVSPLTRALVGRFWTNGRAAQQKDIAQFLTRYADEARRVGRAEASLFGDGPDALDALRAIDPGTFDDIPEIGPARGVTQAPTPDVAEVIPEGSYTDGAASRDAMQADALAEEDLRASIASRDVAADAARPPTADNTRRPAGEALQRAVAARRDEVAAMRADALSDGDFDVPTEGGRVIRASELLDDIEADQVLDTIVGTCTARGAA